MSAAPASLDPLALPDLPPGVGSALWRADQLGRSPSPTCPSGHAALDAVLPGGGWPTAALSEILLDTPGQGELRLLSPLGAVRSEAPSLWIAPPLHPYAPALLDLGWAREQLLWIDPADAADAAWAAEQAVKSRSCAIVLWWAARARPEQLRRLHLAVQGSDSLLFVLRPLQAAGQSSPAPLRLQVQARPEAPGQLSVHLLKRRGPALAGPLQIDTRHQFAPALARRLERPLPCWPNGPARVPAARSTPPSPSPSTPRRPGRADEFVATRPAAGPLPATAQALA